MYRPSRKSAVIISYACCAVTTALVGVFIFCPPLQTYWGALGLMGAAVIGGMIGTWHDGYAVPEREKRESGSVLIWILVAVVLLSALTAAMNQGSRTSTGIMSDQQARLTATEIIAYGDAIAQAVQRLQLKGCSEQEIDFSDHNGVSLGTNNVLTEYNNPYKREDGSCGIFHPNGGGITPQFLNAGYVDPAIVPVGWMHPKGMLLTQQRVEGVGTDGTNGSGTDLVLWMGRLTEQVCLAINNQLGVTNPNGKPPVEADGAYSGCGSTPFAGTYPACANSIGDSAPEVVGKSGFCWVGNGSGVAAEYSRHYIRVLIAR